MTQQTSESGRQLAYLRAVLANMPQGISVFDEHLHLRVWNQGFLDVLELPPEAVYDGVHFSDLIRIPALRGEYGSGDPEEHVRRITGLALKFEAHCFERTRPNGNTNLVQGEPLYIDGHLAGFITTYTNITARKAAEEGLRAQHDLFQTVIEAIPSGISLFDKELKLVLHNQEFLRLLDFPPSLMMQGPVTLERLFRFNAERGEYGPADAEKVVNALIDKVRHPTPHHFERTRPNGVTLEVRGVPLTDGGFVTIYTDVTDRREAAEREQLAQKVYTHTPTGIIFTDEAHRILSINPATTQMTGYESFELVGHTVQSLAHFVAPLAAGDLRAALASTGAWHGELQVTRKNGEDFPAGIRISRVDDPQSGTPAHYIWILVDITERKQAEERMRHMAQTDALTGLPNRLALTTRLCQLLPEAKRHNWIVAVMFIDLDRFKVINDTLGHQIGDELLCEVASRLSAVTRETDFVARLGGDEFVVVLPGIASPSDAAIVGGKIIATLSAPIEVEGHELHTSPSIGISLFPNDGIDANTLLKSADTAMYHAKASGRNNYQFFANDMNRVAAERLDIERKLRHAISRNELALEFQPQFSSGSNEPTGVEALLRWHHPSDGMISPVRFIPIAEETGMIVELGEWVLLNACREMKRWIDAGLKPMRVAVNVSARQLHRRDFCETVANALIITDLSAELLEIEITESSVMENPAEAIQILLKLRAMGISLAIDDFGTGYSSLAYLKLFPITHLKIDRSFVRDIDTDLNDRAIAFGSIALAHSLGLKVIAEGVETNEQIALLRDNGCDEVQGFLLSRPMNSAAAFAFLHARCRAG